MAKSKAGKQALDLFLIDGTIKTVRVGDCVVLRSQQSGKAPDVAKVKKIEPYRNSYNVEVQRYYKPEDSNRGRRKFHGSKELFLSDQINVRSACSIVGKCTVHCLRSFTKLESVGPDDYYSRFDYMAETGAFIPDHVADGHSVFYLYVKPF